MKMPRHFKLFSIISTLSILSISCQKEEQNIVMQKTGEIQIEVTDAPIDQDEIRGAYITISGISLGDTNLLHEKTSIDLLAYQQGNTKKMGTYILPVNHYDFLEITLDLQEDAFGNIPGCFVFTQEGKKHNLYPSSDLTRTLTIPMNEIHISENQRTNLIIDFDLRKLIRYGKNASEVKYQFVDDRSMEESIRVLNKDATGSVRGIFTNEAATSVRTIVFIYAAGSFNKSREIRNLETNIPDFYSAVNSARLDDQGHFYLPYLPKGRYELVFAGFRREASHEFYGLLDAMSSNGTNLEEFYVENGNEVTLHGHLSEGNPN